MRTLVSSTDHLRWALSADHPIPSNDQCMAPLRAEEFPSRVVTEVRRILFDKLFERFQQFVKEET